MKLRAIIDEFLDHEDLLDGDEDSAVNEVRRNLAARRIPVKDSTIRKRRYHMQLIRDRKAART